jgi:diaminohydroxyphosphoribosylaminopyrimidine deaminase/5-amino-6-(5-phosphoribosylamino)uracil reductase
MQQLPQDVRHQQRALYLARNATGFASPNPTVGCVLARGDEVLGEGAHVYDNFDHAEIVALKDAAARRHDVRGATAYVTLEPCSHHGRTGPCSDALIAAGIDRCVVATIDPNPKVRGAGIEKMRAAGIEVQVLESATPLAQEARHLNDAFAWSIQNHGPFVTLKAAVSVDGKLAPPPSQRTGISPHWLTGEAARADVQQLRHASDAILTGIGTILADDPSLTDRTGLPRRRPLLRVVLDSDLRTPPTAKLFNTDSASTLILCSQTAPKDREAALCDRGASISRDYSTMAGPLDIRAALDDFRFRGGVRSILVEGGSAVNGSFLSAGLVDRIVLYYSDTELGNDALPFAKGIASPYVIQQQLLNTERHTFHHGATEDVRISGYLHDPWAGIA